MLEYTGQRVVRVTMVEAQDLTTLVIGMEDLVYTKRHEAGRKAPKDACLIVSGVIHNSSSA